jgi:DNA modification methylase
MLATTLCANSRHIPLADKVVQTCVTSPPYWGLRDYGTAPQVWGGDTTCDHAWGVLGRPHHPGQVEQTKWKTAEAAGKGQTAGSGCWCQTCGAWSGHLGLETTPELYVQHLVEVFREVRRVLRDDGTLWLNIGDSYARDSRVRWDNTLHTDKGWKCDQEMRTAPNLVRDGAGYKPKDLVGIPWMVAFALRADGWYLRQDIIWHKPNPMPESVRDRCTKAHEYLFMLTKSERYYFDIGAIKEPAVGSNHHDLTGGRYAPPGQPVHTGSRKALRSDVESRHRSRIVGGQSLQASPDGLRQKRDVWTIATKPYKGAHFAVFPEALVEPCILAGSKPGDMVLDPFAGSGTTVAVAKRHGRRGVGCELNPTYHALAQARLACVAPGCGYGADRVLRDDGPQDDGDWLDQFLIDVNGA